ncbi:hypothetical protein SASPL_149162 [Salvia splendens]|uniref:Uncharacterized protein n=1 Tax=Salvia splendens TaxID=180675 RepID=A0A8X8Z4S5_SALSN|nr:hypothetical protein SASPL_149162 [Salvia splendens]
MNHNRYKPLRCSFRPINRGRGRGGGGNGANGDDSSSDNFFNFNKEEPPLLVSITTLSWRALCATRLGVTHACLLIAVIGLCLISHNSCWRGWISSSRTGEIGDVSRILSFSHARAETGDNNDSVDEVNGGKRIEVIPGYSKDEFVMHEKVVLFWA